MKEISVLVFPAGTEIGLEIYRSLSKQKFITIWGATSSDDHSALIYENLVEGAPYYNSPDFIKFVKTLVKEKSIDFIFPAHDSVLVELAKWQLEISATILTSSYEVCSLLRSKAQTYLEVQSFLECPRMFTLETALEERKYPYFMKPDIGQGSKGIKKVECEDELIFHSKKKEAMLILEYLPGKEYTVDCFTNSRGELLFSEGRVRSRVLNGISVRTELVSDPEFNKMAKLLNMHFKFLGAWFFQVKEASDGSKKLLEIAPRISGTSGYFRSLGVNLPLLSIYNHFYNNLKINLDSFNVIMDRSLEPKFLLKLDFNNLYVDLDDTLLVKGKVNSSVMKFIFDCRNLGVSVHLITKHALDLQETLKKYWLVEIFDTVIHIKQNDRKYNYMKPKSLLVDDSFVERAQVIDKGFPAISIDCLSSIILRKFNENK